MKIDTFVSFGNIDFVIFLLDRNEGRSERKSWHMKKLEREE